MKKQLLAGAFILASFLTAQAQQLQSENFNALTVGNVGTDLTGETAGQGGLITIVPANGQNSDFQIVNENEAHGNVLQITGDAGPSGTTAATDNRRFLVKTGLGAAWEDRTAGNDILQVSFDFYAAPAAGSTTRQRFLIFNNGTTAETSKVLGGFEYDMTDGALDGMVHYSTAQGTGTYNISLGGTAGAPASIIVPPGSWHRLAFSYNKTTGLVRFASPESDLNFDGSITSTFVIGETPAELDIMIIAGTGNAAAATSKYDNIVIRSAANDDDLLSANEVLASKFSVFPNPVNDIINISNAENMIVNGVEIVDLNGRTVKTAKFDGVAEAQINVSDLASGVYMMTVSSDKGSMTKKIVKN